MNQLIKGYNSRLDLIQAACRRTIAGVCLEALAESQN